MIYTRGHRCDLCVHYTRSTISDEFRKELQERIIRVYGMKPDEEFLPCDGCSNGGINRGFDCDQVKCAKEKGNIKIAFYEFHGKLFCI